jgi:general L-amino acid transport system permease protein
MILFDSVAVTNRGVYIPEPLFTRDLGNLTSGRSSQVLDRDPSSRMVVASVYANRACCATRRGCKMPPACAR